MRHILFLTHWYPNKSDKQAGVFVKRHALCAALKNKVSVLYLQKHLQDKKYEVVEKKVSGNFTEVIIYYKNSSNKLTNLYRIIVAYKKGLERVKIFDLIHCNVTYPVGLMALLIAKLQSKPFVVTEHWTGFLRKRVRIPYWKKCLLRLIVSQAKCVMPVSAALQRGMQEHRLTANYTVVPNVTDTRTFVPIKNMNKVAVFLHISSLKDEQKNISGILDVFLALKKMGNKFRLRIGGREQQSDWLRKEVEKRDLSDFVHILGSLSSQEVAKEMQTANRFVLFSNYETQGCVIAESLSCGLPVVYSDLDAVKEYVPDAFGSAVPPKDQQRLLTVLNHACKAHKHLTMGQKLEMHNYAIQTFSNEVIANKLDEVYCNALTEA